MPRHWATIIRETSENNSNFKIFLVALTRFSFWRGGMGAGL